MGFFTKIKNLIMTSTVTKVVAGAVVVVVLGGTGLVLANTVAKPENILGTAIVKTFTKETPAFEKVFESRRRVLGDTHDDTIHAERELSKICQRTGFNTMASMLAQDIFDKLNKK